MKIPDGWIDLPFDVFQENMLANAEKMTLFAGKRFLGYTSRGAEVWISLEFHRETSELITKATHNLNVLFEEGAKRVDRIITVRKYIDNQPTTEDLIRKTRDNAITILNKNRIDCIKRLLDANEMKFHKAFDKQGRPTTVFFTYLSHAIFRGDDEWERGDTSWSYIMRSEAWRDSFAKKGEYFTVERLPLFIED